MTTTTMEQLLAEARALLDTQRAEAEAARQAAAAEVQRDAAEAEEGLRGYLATLLPDDLVARTTIRFSYNFREANVEIDLADWKLPSLMGWFGITKTRDGMQWRIDERGLGVGTTYTLYAEEETWYVYETDTYRNISVLKVIARAVEVAHLKRAADEEAQLRNARHASWEAERAEREAARAAAPPPARVERDADRTPDSVTTFLAAVVAELERARAKHPPLHSPHEAYAVLKEELEEFWDAVKEQNHDCDGMLVELTQLAAMCARTVADVLNKGGGNGA